MSIGAKDVQIEAGDTVLFQYHLILARRVLAPRREGLPREVLRRDDQLQVLVDLVLLDLLALQELDRLL